VPTSHLPQLQRDLPWSSCLCSFCGAPLPFQVRRLRTLLRNGSLSRVDYERLIDQQVAFAIGVQEAVGIDVLVHGEPEVGMDCCACSTERGSVVLQLCVHAVLLGPTAGCRAGNRALASFVRPAICVSSHGKPFCLKHKCCAGLFMSTPSTLCRNSAVCHNLCCCSAPTWWSTLVSSWVG
jgi:hypothetical protein